jgi:ring-1,2-phenylacetyl-CoA epoxidase subunit PaaD
MTTFTEQDIYQYLEEVKDPEIPVISIVDMGIVRDVNFHGDDLEVVITPTYSGCPAMKEIEDEIIKCLKAKGFERVNVVSSIKESWTTDWLSEKGRKALYDYGIAPPEEASSDKNALLGIERIVKCPNCGSKNTKMVSQFGSTPCKALFKCNDCFEPFDYFKCI